MPIAHLRWNGIGGYDLADPRDQVFAFDYDGSGKLDHLVLYRPGAGTIWILKNSQGQFSAVMAEGAPGHGIGGYDLADPRDQVFAFDYDGSGKLDHLVLYRPGAGTIWILKNSQGQFSAVMAEGAPGHGIGGYDLADPRDQVFAFDYDGSGKLDHLVLYRPGAGTIWILKNSQGQFSAVMAEGAPGHGIGGYDLADPRDQVFAFDYDGSGKLDHLVLYRPGAGTIWILKNSQGQFSAVMAEGAPGHGIGGYDLADPRDQVFAFDYDGSGKLDHLVLYRPGTGIVWALRNAAQHWGPVYETWTLPIEPTLDSAEAGLDFVNLHWTVHNPDASHVQLDWNPADTRGRHSVTGDGGFTGAGVAYLKPGTSYVFSITVQTPTGLTASTTFEVTTLSPPVRTHVPTLTGLHPSEVVSAIHAAVLDFGNVTSDAPWGATDDRIVCIGQSPAPATEVNQHTAVDITYHYIPPGPVGFSSFALHNGTSGLAVTVFRNVNHGGWEDVGALPEGKTYSQALEDGKFYWFVALDGTLPGCDGDPSNVGCQRWTTNAWIPGLGTGGPYIASV